MKETPQNAYVYENSKKNFDTFADIGDEDKGSINRKKIYFAKKFHKTVTPRRGFMKVYFFGAYPSEPF